MASRLDLASPRIHEFCRRWRIRELAVFGSYLRDDLGPESDVDLLVTFDVDSEWSLFDRARVERELEEILGRSVDLVQRRSIETSVHPEFRRSILSTAKSIYAV